LIVTKEYDIIHELNRLKAIPSSAIYEEYKKRLNQQLQTVADDTNCQQYRKKEKQSLKARAGIPTGLFLSGLSFKGENILSPKLNPIKQLFVTVVI
jgi:hypothetical protein